MILNIFKNLKRSGALAYQLYQLSARQSHNVKLAAL